MKTEVITHSAAPTQVAVQARNPGEVLIYAMEKGADMAQIEKLLDLQMKWEANEARKAFVADMAAFKRNPPQIVKDKLVGYENRDGTFTGYKHATLGNVTNAIIEGLSEHGFSHRWDVRQNGAMVEVDCIITHRLGHSEKVSMQAGKDDSGKKNAIQQVASSVSYLQRYTLLAATGLATHDHLDDDGGSPEDDGLAEKWLPLVAEAKDNEKLQAVWNSAIKEIRAADDKNAYDEVKKAVIARKAEIEGEEK